MPKIVYLIQCPEHFGTKVYKIGRSDKGVQRLSSYGKDVHILCALNHNNPVECEKNLIAYYFNTYTLFKGNEYFTVNISEPALKLEFIDIVTNDLKYQKNILPNVAAVDEDVEDVEEGDVEDVEEGDVEEKITKKRNMSTSSVLGKNQYIRYYCRCCEYKADNIHYIKKHELTNKHAKMLKKISDGNDAVIKIKFYACKHCKKEFRCNVTKWKHEKKCESSSQFNEIHEEPADNNKYDVLENKYENLCSKYEIMIENLMSLQNK